MEIRLNKLISEAGVCSRREADNFIEMERVTVNGKQPHVGQKVTAEDLVLVDGERLNVEKYIRLQEEAKKEEQQEKELLGTLRKAKPENKEAGNPRPPNLPMRRNYCGMPCALSSERL